MLKIKRLTSTATLPTRSHEDDAGLDLYADEELTLFSGQRKLVKCGISLNFPKGYVCDIRPRSGLAFKDGITVLNGPGTVDQGYRGEIGVLLINHGAHHYEITPGMRIAQMVFVLCAQLCVLEVDDLESTARNSAGFGSSGV